VDTAGRLYVTNILGNNNSITVYAVGATGNAAPSVTITGSNTGLRNPDGIAVDAAGQFYVTNANGPSITVYAASAAGNAMPLATIAGGNTGLNSPRGIALDAAGRMYVANAGGNSITVYAASAAGNAMPLATIAGSNTGLSNPFGIAFDAAGQLYVANCGCLGGAVASITRYAAGATGNATPTATIAGSNTRLTGPAGIAVDAAGRLYVTNFGSNGISVDSITVYAASATGNATPTATIAGSNTGLSAPAFIVAH
jgi:sugar lactone lactonase YvrE